MYITVESKIDVNDKSTITDFNVINNHTSTANESTSLGGTPDAERGGTEGSLLDGISPSVRKPACCKNGIIDYSNDEVDFKSGSEIFQCSKRNIINSTSRVPPEPPPRINN